MELGGLYLTSIKSREAAMDLFINALEIEDSLQLNHERIFTLLAVARVFEEVEDFVSSAEYVSQAGTSNNIEGDLDIRMLVLEEGGRM